MYALELSGVHIGRNVKIGKKTIYGIQGIKQGAQWEWTGNTAMPPYYMTNSSRVRLVGRKNKNGGAAFYHFSVPFDAEVEFIDE